MAEQFFTIRNLDKPLMDTRIDGSLRQAIYVKLGVLLIRLSEGLEAERNE